MRGLWRRLRELPPVDFAAAVAEVYFEKRVGRAAAELAYFLALTFFPLVICLSQVMGLFRLDLSQGLDEAAHLLPREVSAILREYLRYVQRSRSVPLLAAGLSSAVLFASAAVRGLMDIVEEICGRPHLRGLRQIVASVLFALFLLLTVYLSLGAVVTGGWFFRRLGRLLGLDDLAGRLHLWQGAKYGMMLAVVFLFIFLVYRFAAPPGRSRPPSAVGALAAAVTMVGASVVFGWFVGRFANYSLVYGSLASVVVLLVWLYLCGNILILGSVVNHVRERGRGR